MSNKIQPLSEPLLAGVFSLVEKTSEEFLDVCDVPADLIQRRSSEVVKVIDVAGSHVILADDTWVRQDISM